VLRHEFEVGGVNALESGGDTVKTLTFEKGVMRGAAPGSRPWLEYLEC